MTRVTCKYARLILEVSAQKRTGGLRCRRPPLLLLSVSCFKFDLDIIRKRNSYVTALSSLPFSSFLPCTSACRVMHLLKGLRIRLFISVAVTRTGRGAKRANTGIHKDTRDRKEDYVYHCFASTDVTW